MTTMEKSELPGQLQLENIHALYSKKEILRGASLSIKAGEVVALIGPNGAGKSTLLKVISGFIRPARGSVRFNGSEITSLAPHARVKIGIGYVMQGGKVFPSLSTRENLEIGSLSIAKRDRRQSFAEVLEIFPALKQLLDKRAGLLSGGERQSLALAMVLIKRPRLLLLDEPSASLAPGLVRGLLDKISELSAVSGVSILLVEQNVRGALAIAHRSLALMDGEIVLETARPKQWLTDGQLERLFLDKQEQVDRKRA
jgi:ABC-type branched-subunit amino acid transport system ATPase component